MRKTMMAVSVAATVSLGMSSMASASTMTLDYTGQDPNGRNVYYTWNGSNDSAKAGQFSFDVVGSNPLEKILAFCIDLGNRLITGPTPYTLDNTLLDADKRQALDKLYTQHYDKVFDYDTSAGFQVAIWEIITDFTAGGGVAGLDLDNGDFSLRNGNRQGVIDAAEDFLVLGDAMGGYKLSFFDSTSHPSSQDLVTATPIPLPAAGLLLIAGLGGLAMMRRRG